MNNSVTAKQPDWIRSCVNAANNDDFFKVFRSSMTYQRVIEGSTRESGIWNLKRLIKKPIFIKSLPLIQASDTIGLPQKMIDFSVSISGKNKFPTSYSLSPTTIRYANNAINCLSLFGNKILNGSVNIFEIGAGYGGECKVFNDIAITLYNKKLGKKWKIYDLESSIGIIKRFLSNFGYSAEFKKIKTRQNKSPCAGLVISNGAFSEMTEPLLTDYLNSVIKPAKHGYFLTNFESHSAPYGGWTTEEFIHRLRDCGKTDAMELPTSEYLSYFDSQARSKLVVFGYKKTRKNNVKLINIAQIRIISLVSVMFNNLFKSFIRFRDK